jgi:hypothetical protein
MEGSCQAVRRNGLPCRSRPLPGKPFCFAHDPDLAEARRAGSSRGGQNKRTEARLSRIVPASLKPTLQQLFTALDEVHDGTLDPRQASAMASLAGAIARMYETAELEQRLEALEQTNDQTG